MLKNPRRLLIIDDDVDFVTLLVDYFTLEGFDTVPAHNGPEGLAHLAREPFDLVVLDVMMPGMSGVEVLKKMREKSHIPVLMLTARGDPVDRIVGLELGADDYVQKPCPPRELVARINAILRRSATAWAAAAPVIVGPVTIDPAQRSLNYLLDMLAHLFLRKRSTPKYLVVQWGLMIVQSMFMYPPFAIKFLPLLEKRLPLNLFGALATNSSYILTLEN